MRSSSNSTEKALNHHQQGAGKNSSEPPSANGNESAVVAAKTGAFLVGTRCSTCGGTCPSIVEKTTTVETGGHGSKSETQAAEGAFSEVQTTPDAGLEIAADMDDGTKDDNDHASPSLPAIYIHLPILNPYDRLFSKFDDGVQLDADAWFSVWRSDCPNTLRGA